MALFSFMIPSVVITLVYAQIIIFFKDFPSLSFIQNDLTVILHIGYVDWSLVYHIALSDSFISASIQLCLSLRIWEKSTSDISLSTNVF